MATALTWVFEFEDHDPAEALERAAGVLSADASWRGPWRESDDAGIPTRSAALTLWRLLGEAQVEEPVETHVDVSSDDGTRLRWTIADAGPFCAVTDGSGVPTDHPFHQRTLENAELGTRLAFELVSELCPKSAAAFTDAGALELWNAHVLYWRDEDAAAADLATFGAVPRSEILESHDGHTWRTEDQRKVLSEQLQRLSASTPPTAVSLKRLLAAERFDVYRMEPGFAVLEHPWYVNAFIDRFVFEAFGL